MHWSRRTRNIAAAAAAVTVVAMLTGVLQAYSTYAKWATVPVLFFINPQSSDLSPDAVEAAIGTAMNAWNTQTGTTLQLVYGGRVGVTSTGYDGQNVIVLRNASSGGALGSTYSWWSGNTLVDSDIVFWEQDFAFFSGSSGCGGYNAAYLDDVATHELGHAIGLNHSGDPSATMYGSYSYCSMEQRTLAPDDISAVRSLYSLLDKVINTAPFTSIESPSNYASYPAGTTVWLAGSASDAQDGNLSASLTWTSNIDGVIGHGAAFGRELSPGTHLITAGITDSGGLSASSSLYVTITGSATQPPSIVPTLTVSTGTRSKKWQRINLGWSGISTSTINVYRNGSRIASTSNQGAYVDSINSRASGTFTYRVCDAAGTTCTNEATVSF